MRAGVCTAQQTLSAEAASVLKHSLTLARRRGHAQVTPLHVAATLLSSRASLLRRACLKSQPHQPSHHPLQCRALELCFNVALNRLPATPGPLLHAQPSLSNALVAALKRAQAHQRRGCIEQQQQQPPLIAIKVELEQLILSILDDPSVSRVMREAGFSSTAVKNNLEDTNNSVSSVFQCYNTSGGIYSTPNSPPTESHRDHVLNPSSTFWHSSHLLSYASEQNPNFLFSPQKKPIISDASSSLKEDVHVVFDVLLRKKRKNTVIVGDTLSMAEGVVAEVMGKVERGDNIPEDLKSVHFIKFQFSSVPLRFMKKEEVEMNVSDLKRKVDSFATSGGGVIIYTGDLKWTVDHSGDDERELANNVYSPVDHLIAEIGKMVSWYNNSSSNTRVWLMAIANYQTYMKCQMKQPPLDVHWSLQAVSVPSGGLGLSLNATSGQLDSRINFAKNPSHDLDKRPFNFVKEEQDVLTCCPECKSNYEKEASFKSIQQKSFSLNSINNDTEINGSAQLPFWLKPHGIETLLKDDLIQLRRKYNKMCQSLHKGSHNNPNNPNSVISNQCYLGRDYNWPNKNSIYADSETISFAYPALIKTNQTASSLPRFRRQQSCHIDFSFSNGSSKYQSVEPNLDSLKGIDDKELKITLALGNLTYADSPTSEKMAIDADLFNVFQENVSWQCDTIPSILEDLADSKGNDQDKFILIKGNDMVGKRRFAVGLAKFMFGSSDLLFCMNMRKNAAQSREMLEKALRNHEKLVVLVEDVNYADCEFVNFLAEGYETGKMYNCHAIFILTMDEEKSYDKSKENVDSVIQMKLLVNNLDHNKRKADNWDLQFRSKNQRNNEIDQEVSSDFADNIKIRQLAKESNSNALDLNLKADEEADKSDSTREITPNSLRFLDKIKNRYVLNRDSDQEARAREMFLSKLKRSFDEVCGSRNITSSFTVEEKVLEEILQGSGLYLNSLFEQWLKEVFQTSLRMVDSGNEGERVNIRLCLGGKGESCPEDGFMGTCLPKSIT